MDENQAGALAAGGGAPSPIEVALAWHEREHARLRGVLSHPPRELRDAPTPELAFEVEKSILSPAKSAASGSGGGGVAAAREDLRGAVARRGLRRRRRRPRGSSSTGTSPRRPRAHPPRAPVALARTRPGAAVAPARARALYESSPSASPRRTTTATLRRRGRRRRRPRSAPARRARTTIRWRTPPGNRRGGAREGGGGGEGGEGGRGGGGCFRRAGRSSVRDRDRDGGTARRSTRSTRSTRSRRGVARVDRRRGRRPRRARRGSHGGRRRRVRGGRRPAEHPRAGGTEAGGRDPTGRVTVEPGSDTIAAFVDSSRRLSEFGFQRWLGGGGGASGPPRTSRPIDRKSPETDRRVRGWGGFGRGGAAVDAAGPGAAGPRRSSRPLAAPAPPASPLDELLARPQTGSRRAQVRGRRGGRGRGGLEGAVPAQAR